MTDKIKIFIVDDSKMGQMMLSRLLTETSPHAEVVGESSNASGAIFALEDANPHIVMLKLNIPGDMDSEEALRRIKEVDPNIYIVLCPMPQDREELDNYIRTGKADNFLAKPIQKPALQRLIAAYGQRKRSQQ
ncbi:MAG: response regulator [Defluviitaleaceae bacterium]|nr:response regulator [Defluviitaleaceae bacterium]